MGFLTRLKGRVTKPIADAAGDRKSEAKNEVEARTGRKPDESVIESVEHEQRRKHGDIRS